MANFGGQLCTKPGVVFVPYGEPGDAFADDVAKRLEGTEPTVLLNERLRDALREAVGRLEQRAERLGGAPEAGGPGFRHQPSAYEADAGDLGATPELLEEHFGPVVLFVRYGTRDELLAALDRVEGQLTGTLHAQPGEDVAAVVDALRARVGRVIFDGFPTGVAVTHGMHHGGPFPATSAPAHTSVGMTAITPLAAARRLPERAGGAAPAGAARGQPARHLAPRGRRAHARPRLGGAGHRQHPHPLGQHGHDHALDVLRAAVQRDGAQRVPGEAVLLAHPRREQADRDLVDELEHGPQVQRDRRAQHDVDASSRACGVTTSSGLA